MKVAYIWDTAINVKSFYVKNNTAYTYEKDEPYIFHHSVDSNCFLSGYNYAWIGEGGSFLNLREWENKPLPEDEFDIILYSNEKIGLDDENYDLYKADRLRKQYPNAVLIGNIKESYFHESANPKRIPNRIKFYTECDGISVNGVGTEVKKYQFYRDIEDATGMKFNWVSGGCLVNIDYWYDNIYSNKKSKSIYAYLPQPFERRGRTYAFADYISKKYNVPVKFKPLANGQKFDYLSQMEFINLWKDCLFHFNLDPFYEQPGNQGTQVAAAGCLNLGGHNDSHFILFPETATNNEEILEEKFSNYLTNMNKVYEDLSYAWEKLNEHYGLPVVEKQLQKLIEKYK